VSTEKFWILYKGNETDRYKTHDIEVKVDRLSGYSLGLGFDGTKNDSASESITACTAERPLI
jgi:hypothetical protein